MKKIRLLLLVVVCMFSAVVLMTGCGGDNGNDDEPFGVQNRIAGLWLLTPSDSSISELSDDRWKVLADAALLRLSTLPMDSYNGEPFKYDPERHIIYSVGQNLQDDGGIIPPDKAKNVRTMYSKRSHGVFRSKPSKDDVFRIGIPEDK